MAISGRVCLLWLVLIWACGSDNTPDKEPDGQAIYNKHCVICHGLDGKKGFAGAGDLTVSEMSHKDMFSIISNGKQDNPGKIMTPFKGVLSKKEIEAVATFVGGIRE